MTLEEMKNKITEAQTKQARLTERLEMTKEGLKKQFGTTDIQELKELLESKKQEEEKLSQTINEEMENLSKLLEGCENA